MMNIPTSVRCGCELAKRYLELQQLRSLVEQAEKQRAVQLCRPAGAKKAVRHRRLTSPPFGASLERTYTVNIFNSRGIHVGVVRGASILDLSGQRLYRLKGNNIYRLSGELIGHLPGGRGTEKRLDRSADRLFSRDEHRERSRLMHLPLT
ncbi:MAG TPA: hypothetical protein VM715_12290 [Candidatus Acidoferrum sp.]|nr:hypothetical protein [Candidatus Acidoferrum sp.]